MSQVAQLFPERPQDECPEWLSEDWADFLASREELKKPMTKIARKRMLRKIQRCEAEYSRDTIRQMLDDSMVNGWQNIYPENYPKLSPDHCGSQEPKRKPLSKQLIEQNARPGETYEQAELRLRRDRQ